MKALLCFTCVLALMLGSVHCSDVARMVKILHALTRALHYMQEMVSKINLDAVFCIRQLQEQLHAFLEYDVLVFRSVRHWIEVLRDRAKWIADQGRAQVLQNDPEYATVVGYWMDEDLKFVWYPSRTTSEKFVENRVQCSTLNDRLYETHSDLCYGQIRSNSCNVSEECMKMNSEQYQRDYEITHQLLFWRTLESNNCIDKVPEYLQQRFCSNIMRDAKQIASADFPESHTDLFMEQVAFCGFWGFSDFNKPDWTEKVIDLQHDSGCYSDFTYFYCTDDLQPDPPKRVKRRERIFSDNCLAHKTSMGLLALVSHLRFEAEKAFQGMDKSQNTLNKLLV